MIYNKRTQTLYMPYEKKLLKAMKANEEQVVEFISSLPRERMQIRVKNPDQWHDNDMLTIAGKDVIYTCKVASVGKNRKVVIKKTSEGIGV